MKKAALAVALATALVAGATAQPAPAAIHEVVAAWCSGKGALEPPGIVDNTKQSFARPLFAGGVVKLTPYLDGVLIDFDFDAPQSKIRPASTGPAIVQIAPGLYLERFEISHTAFEHCKALNP